MRFKDEASLKMNRVEIKVGVIRVEDIQDYY